LHTLMPVASRQQGQPPMFCTQFQVHMFS
jgi:hypothetical protein